MKLQVAPVSTVASRSLLLMPIIKDKRLGENWRGLNCGLVLGLGPDLPAMEGPPLAFPWRSRQQLIVRTPFRPHCQQNRMVGFLQSLAKCPGWPQRRQAACGLGINPGENSLPGFVGSTCDEYGLVSLNTARSRSLCRSLCFSISKSSASCINSRRLVKSLLRMYRWYSLLEFRKLGINFVCSS